ncbi:hypothetical protein MKW94_009685 [Papaver nudicaule]|uniref:Dof-type domain-containing protein n=1 Tax=Papaver nudicaule TaxID=74823 RepID=A0AA42AYY2_PAPNU|nr:hypothetical protein [Papaver nudicaule]MCL7044266.1 hypothetical protein [Papaver nudicaule]
MVLEGSSMLSSAYSHIYDTIDTTSATTSSPSNNTATNTNTSIATTTTTTTFSDQQNLRCPRCDSDNTKFSYYNNYNVNQPRHFCKTCRRYWTKGGAFRNVPIGSGRRKNKGSIVLTNSVKPNSKGKIRKASPGIVRSGLCCGYDDELTPSHNQIIWPSQKPQSSQLLDLQRANTPNRNPDFIKEEGNMSGSHMTMDSAVTSMVALNGRSLSLNLLGNSTTPCSVCSYFRRTNNNNQQTLQQQEQQQEQQQGFLEGENMNTEIQELYQRLVSSANCYSSGNSSASILNTAVPSISTASNMFEPVVIAIAGVGNNWNNPSSFDRSNLSTTNVHFDLSNSF